MNGKIKVGIYVCTVTHMFMIMKLIKKISLIMEVDQNFKTLSIRTE